VTDGARIAIITIRIRDALITGVGLFIAEFEAATRVAD
jgi:hypothetical protein